MEVLVPVMVDPGQVSEEIADQLRSGKYKSISSLLNIRGQTKAEKKFLDYMDKSPVLRHTLNQWTNNYESWV